MNEILTMPVLLKTHSDYELCYCYNILTNYCATLNTNWLCTVLLEWHTDYVLCYLNGILTTYYATSMTYWLCTVLLEWHTDYVLCYLNDIPVMYCASWMTTLAIYCLYIASLYAALTHCDVCDVCSVRWPLNSVSWPTSRSRSRTACSVNWSVRRTPSAWTRWRRKSASTRSNYCWPWRMTPW